MLHTLHNKACFAFFHLRNKVRCIISSNKLKREKKNETEMFQIAC